MWPLGEAGEAYTGFFWGGELREINQLEEVGIDGTIIIII